MPYGLTYKKIKELSQAIADKFNIPIDELSNFLIYDLTKRDVARIARNEIEDK